MVRDSLLGFELLGNFQKFHEVSPEENIPPKRSADVVCLSPSEDPVLINVPSPPEIHQHSSYGWEVNSKGWEHAVAAGSCRWWKGKGLWFPSVFPVPSWAEPAVYTA